MWIVIHHCSHDQLQCKRSVILIMNIVNSVHYREDPSSPYVLYTLHHRDYYSVILTLHHQCNMWCFNSHCEDVLLYCMLLYVLIESFGCFSMLQATSYYIFILSSLWIMWLMTAVIMWFSPTHLMFNMYIMISNRNFSHHTECIWLGR